MSLVVIGDGVVVGSSQAPVHDDALHLNPLTTHEALSVSVHGISNTSELAPKITTQIDVTASRALSVVYQNTTGKPMYIYVSIYETTGGGHCNFYVDANPIPTTKVSRQGTNTTPRDVIPCIVLPDYYYKLTPDTGNSSIDTWTEWY